MQSFTDVCTGAVFVYFLKAKSEAIQAKEKFLADVASYGTVKCIRSDNGNEFTNRVSETTEEEQNQTRDVLSCTNPYTALTGRKCDQAKMHKFGSGCYAYQQDRGKLDPRCERGLFVGHDKGSLAFLVYYPNKGKVQKHRLVKFVPKTTCENGTQELGLDPKIDGEERETPQPSVLSKEIQAGGPQSPEDDGEKHPRVTPQASSSGIFPTA